MNKSSALSLVTKSPPPRAGLGGGLRCWCVSGPEAGWQREAGAKAGADQGGRGEGGGGPGEGARDSWCRKEAAWGSGRILSIGLCPKRGIGLWEPQFPCVLNPDLVQKTM